MRTSPIRQELQARGAAFAERHGVELAKSFAERDVEYNRIRQTCGVTDFSYMQVYRVPESTGIDFLDGLLAGNVAKVRYGRVLHTFLADDAGNLVADCYVANNDDELIVTCESVVGDDELDAVFQSAEGVAAGVEKLTGSVAVLGVDGFKAWAVMKEMYGPDVLGLPYMSIENYRFEEQPVRLVRGGKTSEFGYLLIVPSAVAGRLYQVLCAGAVKTGGGACGVAIHGELRLEGRFFNIYAEGAAVRDPLALGLQWMIDFDKAAFRGHDAIVGRRAAGLTRKIVGVATESGTSGLVAGGAICDESGAVAQVVAVCRSLVLDCDVGLALFPVSIAYSGLQFALGTPGGQTVRTISMPPIMPKSLTVKLDEL